MIENAAGRRLTLVSPLTGEISAVNGKVIKSVCGGQWILCLPSRSSETSLHGYFCETYWLDLTNLSQVMEGASLLATSTGQRGAQARALDATDERWLVEVDPFVDEGGPDPEEWADLKVVRDDLETSGCLIRRGEALVSCSEMSWTSRSQFKASAERQRQQQHYSARLAAGCTL